MNLPKIAGYVGVTSSAVSIVSQVASAIIPEQEISDQVRDTLRWSGFVWAYAICTMAFYLIKISHRSIYLFCGVTTALLCLSIRSEFGFGIGLLYFFWAYAKLDQSSGLPF